MRFWEGLIFMDRKDRYCKKADRDDIATLVALAGLVIVLTVVINMISDLFESVKNIFYLY